MPQRREISRRAALGAMAGATASVLGFNAIAARDSVAIAQSKGIFQQSVCKWCYPKMSVEDLAKSAAEMGLASVELLGERQWDAVKAQGLTCAMANGPSGIVRGWNRPQDHDKLIGRSKDLLPKVADAGLPNMIVFSGNRAGLSDADGLKNCAKGLKKIMRTAEKQGVTVCMELLNSRVDHKDYQCDNTEWGVDLVNEVGSDRFKLLFDIYHMGVMGEEVIESIQNNIAHIAHFHTGGVPGRHEIDDTQTLDYPRICQAIVDTGFKGYVAHEFIPTRDPMTSLAEAAEICTV